MRLSDDTLEFKDLINKTAKALNISQEYIEKDYWIYLVLKEIFKDNKNGYVFKGGNPYLNVLNSSIGFLKI